MRDSPLHLRTWFVSVVTLALAAGFLSTAWQLNELAGKAAADYYSKLSELSLQLAVIVVIGGVLKGLADWRDRERESFQASAQQRLEFARRTREMHVTIELARDLLRAHKSPKTYSEQLRRLQRLRFEVEDLQADLAAACDLFDDADDIVAGVEGIASFLRKGAEEYEWAHAFVASDWPATPFEQTVKQRKMSWVASLMAGDGDYATYLKDLTRSKGAIRAQVYGL